MHVIFWERCLTGINKKAEGKASYDEPVEAVSASCITGRAPYNEVYFFTRFEKDETMLEELTYNATTVTRMEKNQ